jgi:hypothetical protein
LDRGAVQYYHGNDSLKELIEQVTDLSEVAIDTE